MAGEERLTDRLRRLGQEVAANFTSNPRIQLQGFAGLGRHGGTIILKEEASAEHDARMIVVKYSYGSLSPDQQSNADNDLRNEYHWLQRLRGAEHIVQLIPMADCSINLPGTSNGETSYEGYISSGRQNQEAGANEPQPAASSARRCPTFALEYLQYDTIHRLERRLNRAGQRHVPSRILWRLWLCMVRQCIAMAFPPDIHEDAYNGQIIREVMQDMYRPWTRITQNSSHAKNFMFSEPTLRGEEHDPGMPILKLIDFGRGRIEDAGECIRRLPNSPDELGSRKNLSGAALVLMRLCCLGSGEDELKMPNRSARYQYTNDLDVICTVQTRAPDVLIENEVIDLRLRNMLVRCLATPWSSKPSLQEVLDETESAIRNEGLDYQQLLTEEAINLGGSETDDHIRTFLQTFLYGKPR